VPDLLQDLEGFPDVVERITDLLLYQDFGTEVAGIIEQRDRASRP